MISGEVKSKRNNSTTGRTLAGSSRSCRSGSISRQGSFNQFVPNKQRKSTLASTYYNPKIKSDKKSPAKKVRQPQTGATPNYRKCDFTHCQTKADYAREISACILSFFDYSIYPAREESNKTRRLLILAVLFVFCAGVILYRLYQIQNTEHQRWRHLASNQQNRSIEIAGVRGIIRDTSGRILATSVQATSLGAHPKQIEDVSGTAKAISELLEVPREEIESKLISDKSFVWLARGRPVRLFDDITELKLKGVVPIKEFKRYYPHGELAATVLGRVSRDGYGQSGIEAMYNKHLIASGYNLDVYRDARGKLVSVSKDNASTDSAENGNTQEASRASLNALSDDSKTDEVRRQGADIVLTLNVYIQGILEEEFAKAQEESKAKAVFGIVMDAESGEILAMAQTPSVNFNLPNIKPEQLRNYSIQANFEPGSTLKPIIAAYALEKKQVSLTEMINSENGKYVVVGKTISDAHPLQKANLADILAHSSNIGMIKIVERLGKYRLNEGLKEFGFGERTGIELEGEESGIFRDVKNWGTLDVASHSFGQGLAVTAIQLMRAYTVIANEGILVNPYIVKEKGKVGEAKRILTPATANAIFDLLAKVTIDGTGKSAKIDGVKVAGKTGTAQKAKLHGGGYDPRKIFSSYIGIVDARDLGVPDRLIMFVGVDEPAVSSRWGGVLAAPVFKRSMERIVSHLLAVDNGGASGNVSSIKAD